MTDIDRVLGKARVFHAVASKRKNLSNFTALATLLESTYSVPLALKRENGGSQA